VREWLIAPLGEEMVACFYKVQDCVFRGDDGSQTFETALKKFFKQFVLTAKNRLFEVKPSFQLGWQGEEETMMLIDGQIAVCDENLQNFGEFPGGF